MRCRPRNRWPTPSTPPSSRRRKRSLFWSAATAALPIWACSFRPDECPHRFAPGADIQMHPMPLTGMAVHLAFAIFSVKGLGAALRLACGSCDTSYMGGNLTTGICDDATVDLVCSGLFVPHHSGPGHTLAQKRHSG